MRLPVIRTCARGIAIGPDAMRMPSLPFSRPRRLIVLPSTVTSGPATIPLAADDAVKAGRLKKGDLVLFAAVGAGFTVGANLWRWSY